MKKIVMSCLLILFAIFLCVGVGFRLTPKPGHFNWQFWLGTIILEVLLSLVGLSVSVAVALNPQFVVKLRPLVRPIWNHQRTKLDEVKFMERIIWFVIGLLMTTLGMLLVLDALVICPALTC